MVSAPSRSYIGLNERFLVGQLLASHHINMSPNADLIYVQSTHVNAGTGKDGRDPNNPLSTVDEAIGNAVAARGDVVVVLPGHIETVTAAGGVALDVAGVTILGVGRGSGRPTFNFTTAATASVLVTAANCAIINCLFTGGIDDLTKPLHIQAADFALYDCEMRDVTGQIKVGVLTTAAADRLHIRGFFYNGAEAAGCDSAIRLVGGDHIVIEDFNIIGNFAVAGIENVTTAGTNYEIHGGARGSYIWTKNAADVAVALAATTTGRVGPNISAMLTDNAANVTEAFVGAAVQFFQPINIVNLVGESSMFTNITATTDA